MKEMRTKTAVKEKRFSVKQITVLGLMSGILLLMAYTPLGYLNIGPLAITFNVIPVAISAIALGPVGGAVAGSIFGLTSFGQCIGIGGTSIMGATLFAVSPFLAFVQRFVPRMLFGLLLGFIFRFMHRRTRNLPVSCAVTGFLSAFLNTLFFMTALILLFGRTEYVQELIGGRNILLFVCTFVGFNAVCEMISSTVLTTAIATALFRAKVIEAAP